MKTFSLFTLLVAIGVGTAFMLVGHHRNQFASPNTIAAQSTDGAFRDGMYLGKLAAERGTASHVAIGRWSTAADRLSFTAGYQQGYSEFLASQVAPTARERRSE
jgi:hypothetical protein